MVWSKLPSASPQLQESFVITHHGTPLDRHNQDCPRLLADHVRHAWQPTVGLTSSQDRSVRQRIRTRSLHEHQQQQHVLLRCPAAVAQHNTKVGCATTAAAGSLHDAGALAAAADECKRQQRRAQPCACGHIRWIEARSAALSRRGARALMRDFRRCEPRRAYGLMRQHPLLLSHAEPSPWC